MELELATNQELIDELINRKTFVGMVVSSRDQHKFVSQIHHDFRITTNLPKEQTVQLMRRLTPVLP
jgi:hypothetical protein